MSLRSRYAVRTPFFHLKTEFLIVLIVMALLIIARTAAAETSTKVRKSTTTITTTETEGEEVEAEPTPVPGEEKEFIVTKVFGSKAQTGTAGCKTEELSEQVVQKLESECNTWIKKQKGELKKKYQTGTCEESCTDCGMSLKRCTVTGTVHYSK